MNVKIFCLLLEDPHPVKVLSMPFDKLMLTYVIVTAIAATAAVVTLFAIRGQLKAMRAQLDQMKAAGEQTDKLIVIADRQAAALSVSAEAAKKNAEAAALNAQALIDSERPWLFVNSQISNTNITPPPGAANYIPSQFKFSLNNAGRTPAELLYFYANYSVCPAGEVDDVRVQERQLGRDFVHRKIFSPGDPVENILNFEIRTSRLTDDDVRDLANSRMRLVFFGMSRYRDTTGGAHAPIRETWFQFFFDVPSRTLIMCGPEGANRHT